MNLDVSRVWHLDIGGVKPPYPDILMEDIIWMWTNCSGGGIRYLGVAVHFNIDDVWQPSSIGKVEELNAVEYLIQKWLD